MPTRFANTRKMAQLSTELLRYRLHRAPAIVAKALVARTCYDIELSRFLMVGMYAQRIGSWPDSMGYVSDLEPGLRTLNWHGDAKRLTVDKLAMAERFAQAGIPCARLIGVVGRDDARYPHEGGLPLLRSIPQVEGALAAAPEQLFIKPATGWRGDGIFGAVREGDAWRVDKHRFTHRELAQRLLSAAPPGGLLIQERVRSHRDLAPIGGQLGLGTVRINTAHTVQGPEVIFVFGKIMGAEGLVDNFAGGKFGNLLARLDPHTGRILHVFGRRRGQQYLMESVTHHPATGTRLIGFQIPLWIEAVALAKRAATAFAEAPLLGADIALTDAGPLVIEMQSDWDANAPQLLTGQGLRPLLRNIVPRLVASDELRERAFRQMGLGERARRRRSTPREARV